MVSSGCGSGGLEVQRQKEAEPRHGEHTQPSIDGFVPRTFSIFPISMSLGPLASPDEEGPFFAPSIFSFCDIGPWGALGTMRWSS